MNSMEYWNLFVQTGAPDFYVKYNKAKRLENAHVSNDPGARAPGHRLQ